MNATVDTQYSIVPSRAFVNLTIGGIRFTAEEPIAFRDGEPVRTQDLADVEALARAVAERFNQKREGGA